MGFQEQVHEQGLQRDLVVTDLVIARRLPDPAVLQPVQRRLASKHRTIFSLRRQAFRHKREHRVVAKRVVVVDVLVSQRDRCDALPDQRADAVNREILIAVIDETRGHPAEQPYGPINVTQKQGASV